MDEPNATITEEEKRKAGELDVEHVKAVALGLVNEFDEAVDGCTVYEPDGWCPHGYRGLAQVASLIHFGV